MYIWLPRVLQISSWTAEFRLRLQHGTMQYSSITAANTFERNYKKTYFWTLTNTIPRRSGTVYKCL